MQEHIPLSIINDLICFKCEQFVNCGPVFVAPDGPEGSIICGRCQHVAKPVFKNTSYEALASIFLYPCSNWENYCPMALPWNVSLQHELECSYRSCCTRFWQHPTVMCAGMRELPYGDIRHMAVPDRLLDFLRCVQCQNYLSCEPIFIQSNGKNICHRCIYSNGIPPNCLRNRAYEMLACIMFFPCIYRNSGCPTRLKFGRDIWDHECNCLYNHIRIKKLNKTGLKEKGVIQTHSGHYYGTITPANVPFAPPAHKNEIDVNKKLMKSLHKRQDRKRMEAEAIDYSVNRVTSEDDSISTEESYRNGLDRHSSNSESLRSRSSDIDSPRRNIQNFLDSGYSTPSRTPNEPSYQNHTSIAPIHQNYRPEQNVARTSSYRIQYLTAKPVDPRINQPRSSYHEKYEDSKKFISGAPALTRTDSDRLVSELKVVQSRIIRNGSIREPQGNPYKRCNNLEEVKRVHDRIAR